MAKKNWIENLNFQFDSEGAAEHFWTWLQESGEQEYWTWMAEREQEEDGDITVLQFSRRKDGLIVAKCGRFTEYKGFPDE